MESLSNLVKLVSVLIIVAGLASISMFLYGCIPFLGNLPGDFLFLLPSGALFVPLTSSIAVGAILTAIAYFVSFTSKK